MINPKIFYEFLRKEGIDFITGVPDSLLNDFCNFIQANMKNDRHIITANEGNAIALAAGYNIATGSIPLVYMQNSGIGNSLNPLISLTYENVYAIPLIMLIGWRGEPAVSDHVHHKKQGQLTPVLLDNLDIPYRVLEENNAYSVVQWAKRTATEKSIPVAIIVKKGVLSKGKKTEVEYKSNKGFLTREEAIACVLNSLPEDTRYVATTGRTTRELFHLREKYNMSHDKDFLNVGAMGHASSIASGIAIGQRKHIVVCLDGDAALIMHLGSLTTIGQLKLSNFVHIVLNNGAHESVGGQPTAGYRVNLTAIAESSGYKTFGRAVDSVELIEKALEILIPSDKPVFIDVRVKKGIRIDLGQLILNHRNSKDDFFKSLNKEL
jgi:phosphonopyruvate decarboxylase